jgi:PPOX class probable FMN-dependent enzyme
MKAEFSEVITSEEQLRQVVGHPAERNVQKVIPVIDEHCRMFIVKSPFMLLATSDLHGKIDVSPKGDPPGFVQVLDESTLAIPDRPGNRRADSLTNILQNPWVGLLFMIPGKRETLRVSGSARIVRDVWLREQMAVNGKLPALAVVVRVKEAFIHCAKCVIRSHLWESEQWPDLAGLAPISRVIIDHADLTIDVDEYQQAIDENLRNALY